MTGYGGGLPRKRLLLELEARTASSRQLGLPGYVGSVRPRKPDQQSPEPSDGGD